MFQANIMWLGTNGSLITPHFHLLWLVLRCLSRKKWPQFLLCIGLPPAFCDPLNSWPKGTVIHRSEIPRKQRELAASKKDWMLEKIRGEFVTISVDGWTNCVHDKVINVVLLAGNMHPIYWTSLSVDDNTSESIATALIRCLPNLLQRKLSSLG